MYRFDSRINPDKPLDKNDPCPPGWREAEEDAKDRSKQFWSFEPSHLIPWIRWEKRELARWAARKNKKRVKRKRAA